MSWKIVKLRKYLSLKRLVKVIRSRKVLEFLEVKYVFREKIYNICLWFKVLKVRNLVKGNIWK